MKNKHAVLIFLGVMLLGIVSCHSVVPHKLGGNPADLNPGAHPSRVIYKMGKPEWKEAGPNGEGQIWHYVDYWHTRDKWANKFASWDLYFTEDDDQDLRLTGWKLVDPPIQEADARQAFFDLNTSD